jgi:accessory Sec system S-layer assembly protein
MLSFLKKNKSIKSLGEESTVSSSDLLNEENVELNENEDIHTELFFHPEWTLSNEDKYVYQFLNMECPPLKPNQISLSGIELIEEDNIYLVSVFIRNSLSKAIRLEKTSLLLLDDTGQVAGRKTFDLTALGEIPAVSSMPWTFVFEKGTMIKKEVNPQGWKLAFELKKPVKHSLDLAESWEKSLPEEDKEKLIQLTNSLSVPKPGEVNFMGLQVKLEDTGDLYATLLIRNGSDKNITLQHVPLEVFDHSKEVVARGSFSMDDFEVKAHTSKPWTFIFPKDFVLKDPANLDFTTFRVAPPQTSK